MDQGKRKPKSHSSGFEQETLLNQIVNRIRCSLDLSEILNTTVQEIRLFLEIDRVKIYRFDPDGNGQVIAESREGNKLSSLLGLHFPAADIPDLARQRFIKTRQRAIVDLVAELKITNSLDCFETGETLMTEKIRYAVIEPCHAEYLTNMGISSSLVIPILHQKQLWGLLCCHHSQPRKFTDSQLNFIQLIVDQLSIAIAQSKLLSRAQQKATNEAIINHVNTLLNSSKDVTEIWQAVLEETVKALDSHSGRLYIIPEHHDKLPELYITGTQPNYSWIEEMFFWQSIMCKNEATNIKDQKDLTRSNQNPKSQTLTNLNANPSNKSKVSTTIDQKIIPYPYTINDLYKKPQLQLLVSAFESTAIRSILILPLGYQQQCVGCLTIFRNEMEVETLWAGNQNEDEDNSRLESKGGLPRRVSVQDRPRKSFKPWREIKKGQIKEWTTEEVKLAESLGIRLYLSIMQRRVEEMILHQESHDSLTNLGNKMLFEKQLSLALANSHQRQEMLAVAFMDLDSFKLVNDTLGHALGDQLLQIVAARLKNSLRNCDLIARWGGDEFTFLLPRVASAEDAGKISQRILKSLKTPFHLKGQDFYVKASLGIAIAPYDGVDAQTLLKNADAALYRAKQKGRNQYQLYKPAIGIQAQQRLMLENNLYKALEREEFLLYYQPQLDLKTGKVLGMEVLIRWKHPELGLISPAQFIPIAEETGLILPIGEWVLHTACSQNQRWQKQGLPPLRIAVNLSARQFQQRNLVTIISQILDSTGLDPQYLELEITESAAMDDIAFATATLQALKHMGVQSSMDDFGTGYSSLWTLKRFPLNTLKIDQSFIQNIMSDHSDASIIKAVIAMGQGLNLKVIAEGVETSQQLDFLKTIGCDAIQGFFFSKPLSAEDLAKIYNHQDYQF